MIARGSVFHVRWHIQELHDARQPAQRIIAILRRLIRLVGVRRHPSHLVAC